MKARDSQSHKWSEADVDSLLTEFFRAEMPAELRRPLPARVSSVQGREPGRDRRAAGFKGLAAAACALLLAVTALSPAGRKLVAPEAGESVVSRTKSPPNHTADAKKRTAAVPVIVGKEPGTTLPPAFWNMLPPELRPSFENAVRVSDGAADGDPLDLREMLRIEVFEPRDDPKTRKRRVPEKRPRLPEER